MAGGSSDPSSLINKAAKAALAPLGARRKGRSRFWYVDNGWYVTGIEFRPASYAQGAGLTLGVGWLWIPKETWSFDVLLQHDAHVAFDTVDRFAPEIARMAERAAGYVRSTADRLQSLHKAYAATQPTDAPGNWAHVHSGVLAALLHKTDAAVGHLNEALGPTDGIAWRVERNAFCQELLALLSDGEDCRALIEARIRKGRDLLALPARAEPVLP
ncbi:MAG: hypothetical protein AAFR46_09270 [Pseudomonadota bacterium]